MSYFVLKQVPTPPPDEFDQATPWSDSQPFEQWATDRALRLIYTHHALEPLAMSVGFDGPPFAWDDADRELASAELDAGFFLLARLDRPQVEHVLQSFRVLRENETKQHGEFATRRRVLDAYDRLAAAGPAG